MDITTTDTSFEITTDAKDKTALVPYIKRHKGEVINVKIESECVITNTKAGGIICLSLLKPDFKFNETLSLSRKQMNTIKLLEKYVCWIMLGEPPEPSDVQYIHEAFKETIGPKIGLNKMADKIGRADVCKSLSSFTSEESSLFIQGIWKMIMTLEVPSNVEKLIQNDVIKLLRNWSEIIGALKHLDHLTIQEYKDLHPYSQVSGIGHAVDPMHIVSKGANEEAYQYSWNIIMGTREEHSKQHNIGWEAFIKLHPHLKTKYDRAYRMVAKLNE